MAGAWLTACAAALLESVPFILIGAALARTPLLRRHRLAAFLGCGCDTGPSARSLPGALFTVMTFGIPVALARLIAACALPRKRSMCAASNEPSLLEMLRALLPAAIGAGFAATFGPTLLATHVAPLYAAIAGAAAAFIAAPCAIAAPVLAASLRAYSPFASIGFLCVAGIVDLRAFVAPRISNGKTHDAAAYALLAIACAIAALRAGAELVHPLFTLPLALAALACAYLTFVHRSAVAKRLRVAPALLLTGIIVHAPPASYHATETTLAQAFPGEAIDFTGVATQTRNVTTIVRYAITCCRADATPVVLRLERARPQLRGWIHARGTIVASNERLMLRPATLHAIAPPLDAFIYR